MNILYFGIKSQHKSLLLCLYVIKIYDLLVTYNVLEMKYKKCHIWNTDAEEYDAQWPMNIIYEAKN